MIREPYIGMPIILGGTAGCISGCAACRPEMPGPSQPPQPSQPSQPPAGFDAQLLAGLPLAMAYTPMQQWKTTYPQNTALQRGTIFPQLDLPFEGGMRP